MEHTNEIELRSKTIAEEYERNNREFLAQYDTDDKQIDYYTGLAMKLFAEFEIDGTFTKVGVRKNVAEWFANKKSQMERFRKHPYWSEEAKAIVFLQTEKRASALFDLSAKKRNDDQRAAAEKLMKVVMKDFKNVYFINPAFEIGDDNEATVDGSHLTTVGIERALSVIEPELRKILSQHGIK
jgi:hypothetical protein